MEFIIKDCSRRMQASTWRHISILDNYHGFAINTCMQIVWTILHRLSQLLCVIGGMHTILIHALV